MEDTQSFLLSSYLGHAPLTTTTADTDSMGPPSFSLTQRAGTCSPIIAGKGGEGEPKLYDSKTMWFSSLLFFHAVYMQSHSFRISNLVLPVPPQKFVNR
jgi:hypothetical protein